jgi:hypothetical protein
VSRVKSDANFFNAKLKGSYFKIPHQIGRLAFEEFAFKLHWNGALYCTCRSRQFATSPRSPFLVPTLLRRSPSSASSIAICRSTRALSLFTFRFDEADGQTGLRPQPLECLSSKDCPKAFSHVPAAIAAHRRRLARLSAASAVHKSGSSRLACGKPPTFLLPSVYSRRTLSARPTQRVSELINGPFHDPPGRQAQTRAAVHACHPSSAPSASHTSFFSLGHTVQLVAASLYEGKRTDYAPIISSYSASHGPSFAPGCPTHGVFV